MNATPQMLLQSENRKLNWIDRNATRTLLVALLFAAIAATYLQWFPHHYRQFTVEDSGLFMHVGQRLLQGDLLYRDIADNKPPLIYWVNALGLLLGRGSPGGVLLLCLASGLATYAVVYLGLRRYCSWQALVIGCCLAQLAFLACTKHPNYTESFSLPLVALAAVLLAREILQGESAPWVCVAQGVIAGLLFSWRPNNIGVSMLYGAFTLVAGPRRIRSLALFGVSALAAYGLVLAPLFVQGIAGDYRVAALQQAGTYAGENGLATRFSAFWHGLNIFMESPLLYFSLACAAVAALTRLRRPHMRLAFWLTAWLALEMLLSSTSGYRWDHYYLLWILPLTLLLILIGPLVSDGINPLLPVVLAAALELVVLNQAAVTFYRAWRYPREADPALALAQTYARPGDRVTTWGYFVHDLWFELDHKPGTRLFHEGEYTNRQIYRALMPGFLSDLDKNRPRVVVERRSAVPLFAPPAPDQPLNDAFQPGYFSGWDDAEITKRKAELSRFYSPVTEKTGVVVYLRRQ